MRILTVALMLAAGLVCRAARSDDTLTDVAARAISPAATVRDAAIERLRGAGPAGLDALFSTYARDVEAHWASLAIGAPPDPRWQRISSAIDHVAAQRDAAASRLYWYTDLSTAKRAAAEQHKPILSLRLLGRLDEEYSCANSRFFRTALYANREVSRYLAGHFVLHWQSVRPVPRITIDFGDGRKIERTITGNSIHYVLAPDGRVIDGLPGLYAPAAFLHLLETAETAADHYAELPAGPAADEYLADFHRAQAQHALAAWYRDLQSVGAAPAARSSVEPTARGKEPANPTAAEAAPIGSRELQVERPTPVAAIPDAAELARAADGPAWQKIAQLHTVEAALDASSIALMRAQQDPAEAMRRTMSKAMVEDPLLRVVANFQRSIAEDSVRNEYLLHRQLHEWLAAGALARADAETLNDKVYAELFLTPRTDPWLGLAPADTYTGLDCGGLVQAQR